jgi:hypothetical protein
MKRTDLAVDAELYLGPRGWATQPALGRRVRVLDTRPYRWPWQPGHSPEPELADGGVGVLVEVFTPGDPVPMRQVVTIGTLRGPYTEMTAQVAAAAAEAEQRHQERWHDQQRQRAVQDNVIDRALALGFDPSRPADSLDLVALPAGQLARLLDLFDRNQLRGVAC